MGDLPIVGKWQGSIITKWDHGSPPRSFQIKINEPDLADISDGSGLTGKLTGRGVSCGQAFALKGNFDFGRKIITFHMTFSDGHPPEEFTGRINPLGRLHPNPLDDDIKSITATIKVKPAWYQNKPLAVDPVLFPFQCEPKFQEMRDY
ncbi:hypothetical protein BDZ97DRAFT_1912986 [Flammula alnicola]|nr:hypothetical protein BDZ97DRAFT_1912986 [Flammula alnicola]